MPLNSLILYLSPLGQQICPLVEESIKLHQQEEGVKRGLPAAGSSQEPEITGSEGPPFLSAVTGGHSAGRQSPILWCGEPRAMRTPSVRFGSITVPFGIPHLSGDAHCNKISNLLFKDVYLTKKKVVVVFC